MSAWRAMLIVWRTNDRWRAAGMTLEESTTDAPPCLGKTEMMFPGPGESYEPGLRLCETCPPETKAHCASLVRSNWGTGSGIWGGRVVGVEPSRCRKCNGRYRGAQGRGNVCRSCVPWTEVVEKTCKQCERVFYPRRKNQLYCSSRCQQRKYAGSKITDDIPESRVCEGCHGTFEPRSVHHVFCTSECRIENQSDRPMDEPRTCARPECGEVFMPNSAPQIHCSAFCRIKHRNDRAQERKVAMRQQAGS